MTLTFPLSLQSKVCLLVTEGKEQSNLKDSMTAKEFTNKKLATHSDVVDSLCPSPRLVPTEFNPKCIETFIRTDTESFPKKEEDRKDDRQLQTAPSKRPTLQAPTTSKDLRNFFQPISNQPTVRRIVRGDSPKGSPAPVSIRESTDDSNDILNVPTFWQVLEDGKSSSTLKSYAIRSNISAWKEKFLAQTLDPVYESTILKTIGDPSSISKLLNGYQRPKRTAIYIAEFDCPNEPYDPLYSAKLADRLSRQRKIPKLEEISNIGSANATISQPNDVEPMDLGVQQSQAFIPFFDEIESKYEDARMANDSKVSQFNTPKALKRMPLKSSTPLSSKRTNNRSVGRMKDSPLVRAFEKSKALNESKMEMKRIRKKERKVSTLTEALAFLGLRDVLDIFVDPVECCESEADSQKLPGHLVHKSSPPNCQKIIVDTPIGVALTDATQPKSQYTVSQILQIVNLSQNPADGETSEINNSSVLNRSVGKEIFIGTIEDIFGSFDSVECDKKLSHEKHSTRKRDDEDEEEEEEDVIASSQPVISEIKLPSKYLSSNVNKKPAEHPELDGDDMFASFAKTNSPILKSPAPASPLPNLNSSKNLPSTRFQVPSIRPTTNTSFKSPSPSNTTVKPTDRSPSVFSRKINLSRLKALSMKSNSERMPSNNLQSKSPLFFSCRSLDVKSKQPIDEPESEHSDDGSQVGELFCLHSYFWTLQSPNIFFLNHSGYLQRVSECRFENHTGERFLVTLLHSVSGDPTWVTHVFFRP